jgi:hypothetical protein
MTRFVTTMSTTTTTTTTTTTLDAVAARLLADGIQADDLGLLVIAHAARAHNLNEALVAVMLDEHEPEVSRLRAFALIAARLGSVLNLGQSTNDLPERDGDAAATEMRELLPA